MAEAGSALDLKDVDVQTLLGRLQEGSLSKELVLALERCVCEEAGPESEGAEALRDRQHFLLLLRSLEQLGAEKAVQLGILR